MSLKNLFSILASCLLVLLLWNCSNEPDIPVEIKTTDSKVKSTPIIDYLYVNSHPHDTSSFTEGFLFFNGELYESTGATAELPTTKSLFGIVNTATGVIDVKVELDKTKYFGEGIAFLDDKVFQLTYKAKIGFIYDAINFQELGKFDLPSEEGWGLTTDGTHLIMSDGTDALYYLDSKTLKVTKTITASENGYSQHKLNELEYINGFIYANIWMTNIIVKIDPENGEIVGKLNLTSLANEAKHFYPQLLEMNGIAFDSVSGNIFVTGKLWPKIFEIKLSN